MITLSGTRRPPVLLLSACGVIAAAFIGLCFAAGWTTFSFSPDGRVYVDVARHTVAGDGMQRSWTHWDDPRETAPMVHYAPAYPLALAAFSVLSGSDPAACAPILNALLLGLTTFLAGWLIWSITGRYGPCVMGMGAVSCLEGVWVCHTQALSEPLFLALFLFVLIMLLRYADTRGWGILLIAAAGAGLCVVARYQGVFLLPVGALWIWCTTAPSTDQRLRHTTSWIAVAVVPIGCWQLRNLIVAVDQPVREAGIHWPGHEAWWSLHATVTGWFSTTGWPDWIRLALPLAAAGLTIRILWHHGQRRWLVLGLLVCGGQFVFLLIVRTFFDAAMPFDDRIMSSIGVVVVLSMIVALATCSWRHTLGRPLAVVLSLALITNIDNVLRLAPAAPHATAQPPWLVELSELGPERTVYTNRAGEIIWHARQPAKFLPEGTSLELADALVRRLQDTAGIVVYFHATSGREHLISLNALEGRADLEVHTTPHATLLTPRPLHKSAQRAPAK